MPKEAFIDVDVETVRISSPDRIVFPDRGWTKLDVANHFALVAEGATPAEWGASLYQAKACITCHSVDGSRKTGPSFLGIFGHDAELADGSTVLVDENYIRQSILEPNSQVVAGYQPVMPTYQGTLTSEEIDALIEFIKAQK